MQFKIAYEEYLSYINGYLKISSITDKHKIFNRFILPHFENVEIEGLTKEMLKVWQCSLDKYSYKYKSKIRGYLFNFLDWCEYEYNITNNLRKVRNFKKEKYVKQSKFVLHTENEFNRLMKYVDNIEDKAIFNLLYL